MTSFPAIASSIQNPKHNLSWDPQTWLVIGHVVFMRGYINFIIYINDIRNLLEIKTIMGDDIIL